MLDAYASPASLEPGALIFDHLDPLSTVKEKMWLFPAFLVLFRGGLMTGKASAFPVEGLVLKNKQSPSAYDLQSSLRAQNLLSFPFPFDHLSRRLTKTWNPDFSNLQGERNLIRT